MNELWKQKKIPKIYWT